LGPEKSDLFRYYYLYKNGGVYIDTDAMLYKDINYIVNNYDFFVSKSNINCFIGFIGSSPNNKIIKEVLLDAYNTNLTYHYRDYHGLFHLKLKEIIENTNLTNSKILIDNIIDVNHSIIYDENDLVNPICIHYYGGSKIIPK